MNGTVKIAFKASLPVIFGYVSAAFIFGLMLTARGFHAVVAVIMSVVIYAGAGQYLAVGLLAANSSFIQIGLATFLINSKHLFYGISLLKDYKNTGLKKIYLMFALTDETYAVLTSGIQNSTETTKTDRVDFCLYVSLFNHVSWICGTVLGAVAGSVITFNTDGMDFAMVALFIVIVLGQWEKYKSKLPFAIGLLSAVFSYIAFGKSNILLCASIISVLMLIIFRKKIERDDG